jgi:hypothetical protein
LKENNNNPFINKRGLVAYFAAWAGVSFSTSYISPSQSMNFAYRLLTKSKETYKSRT